MIGYIRIPQDGRHIRIVKDRIEAVKTLINSGWGPWLPGVFLGWILTAREGDSYYLNGYTALPELWIISPGI